MGQASDICADIDRIVGLRQVAEAVSEPAKKRLLARVIRDLRLGLDVGIPKHQAARALNISPQALDRWVKAGKLPTVKRPGSSRELLDRDPLIRLVEEARRLEDAGETHPVAKAIHNLSEQGLLRRKPEPNQSAEELRFEFLNSTPEGRFDSTVALAHAGFELAKAAQTAQRASA